MLIQLKTKNFRKLRDRTFDFTPGLNVLRGANEEGKSTMLEAIAYAFFGIKACRESLDEVVTWGENPNTLRVDLMFAAEGVTYHLKRSKSGAELRFGDNSVTGQSEVTAFIGRLFGTEPANIPNLVLAGQGDIRGALDKGPKAATELIEDLANFSVIDNIITLIGEKLLTGSPTPFEEKVARLTPELEELEAALAEVPDTRVEEDALAAARQGIEATQLRMDGASNEIAPKAAERDRLKAMLDERVRLDERYKLLASQCDDAEQALRRLEAQEPPVPDTDRTEVLRGLLADEERLERARSVKAEIEALPPATAEWDEGLESFNAETNRVKARSQAIQKELNELTAEAREQRAKRVAASACGICGKDVSTLPEVIEKNRLIEARLAGIVEMETVLRTELKDLAETLHDLEKVYAEHSKIERLAARFGDLCAIDKAVVPWRLSYAGPELPENGRAGALRVELNELTKQETMRTVWTTKVEQAKAALLRINGSCKGAFVELNAEKYVVAERILPIVQAEVDEINRVYTDAAAEHYHLKEQAAGLEADINSKRAVYDAAKARVDAVRSQLAEAQKDLASVNFNNALKKRVQAARPIIANKLWSKVLATVSRYFSLMRGTESVVVKDGDGFKVNGRSIEGLSGSTKDILGLAIRLALVRTFLPAAPFLILDEPSAACDAQRTEAMMGFLVGAGFNQMLVVTHEDTSEQVAEALIEM